MPLLVHSILSPKISGLTVLSTLSVTRTEAANGPVSSASSGTAREQTMRLRLVAKTQKPATARFFHNICHSCHRKVLPSFAKDFIISAPAARQHTCRPSADFLSDTSFERVVSGRHTHPFCRPSAGCLSATSFELVGKKEGSPGSVHERIGRAGGGGSIDGAGGTRVAFPSAVHAADEGAHMASGTALPVGKLVPTAHLGQLAFQSAGVADDSGTYHRTRSAFTAVVAI